MEPYWNSEDRDFNLLNYGIDFAHAFDLFNGPVVHGPPLPDRTLGDVIIGVMHDKLVVAIYIPQGSRARLIRIRAATDAEKELFFDWVQRHPIA